MTEIPIEEKNKVALADAMISRYMAITEYGNRRIDELSAKFVEFFGRSADKLLPHGPPKKVRDLVLGLDEDTLLKLCAYLSNNEPKLGEAFNDILRASGFQLKNGSVVSGLEQELGLTESDESFSSFLESVGLGSHLSLIQSSLSDPHAGRIHPASSQMCLALEGVLKSALVWNSAHVSDRASLGTLVTLARRSLIEDEVFPLFQGFVSLRNRRPQHAGSGGSVAPLSDDSAFLLAHAGRSLVGYLAMRIRKMGLHP